MLEPNRLDPPRPHRESTPAGSRTPRIDERLFVSPDDFDTTGILMGFDPCASSYWWMPELHAGVAANAAPNAGPMIASGTHATRRTTSRAQAAA